MATKDISRRLFRPTQRYAGARTQQERVLLDSCWNESDEERADLRRRTISDIVGCSGTLDCGFKLSFCSPYTVIEAGVMYAGGMRFSLDAPRYLYGQPDLLKSPLLEVFFRDELPEGWAATFPMLLYLEGFEAPVTPVEDRELFDPALGGVDTTVRVRRFARVLFDPRAPDDPSATCKELWQRFKDGPPFNPAAKLEADCTLTSPIRLTVGFVDDLEAEDDCELCEPGFRRGYRLAEAQAIRVMLSRDGRRFTWGFENAAPLYRVKVVGKEVELLTAPRDGFHTPQPGQTVELLSWGALLPNGEKTAEPVGAFTRVEKLDGSRKLILEDDVSLLVSRVPPPLRGLYPEEDQHAIQCDTHLYMRVWLRGADRESPATRPIVAPDGTTEHRLGFTGLTVRFDLDEGAERGCFGDFWVIAARPEHPDLVVPWTLLDGERPHGPRRAYAPIAVAKPAIQLPGTIVTPTPFPGVLVGPAQIGTPTGPAELGFAAPQVVPCDDLGVGAAAAASFSCEASFNVSVSALPTFHLGTDVAGRDAAGRVIPLLFEDCRPRFRPLTRETGCCTVTAGRGCQYETLQEAVDALPEEGGRVCLVRGTLTGRTVIAGRRDIEIVGSGPGSIVTVDEPSPGTEPVIDIQDSQRVTLRDFTVAAVAIPGIRVARTEGSVPASESRLRGLTVRADGSPGEVAFGARAAVSIVNGLDDRIEDCRLSMDGSIIGAEPALYLWGTDQLVAHSEILTTGADAAIAWGGLQIDGGSERVRIVRNRIEAGLGHGITIGGVAHVTSPLPPVGGVLTPPLPASERVPVGSIMLAAGPGDPEVRLVVPPGGGLVAVPTGFLRFIEIRENTIVGMGTTGIGAAGFFDDDVPGRYGYVLVDRLEIVENVVEDNLRRAPQYPAQSSLGPLSAAAGGIALGAVNQTRIRGNQIRANGDERPEPVCGIFVQLGALEIASNRIEGNGLNLVESETSVPILGVRAGIAMPQVVEPIDLDTFAPIALPGTRIVSNLIRVPEGKALQISTNTNIAILKNDALTRGDNAPLDFPFTYVVSVRALNGAGTGAAVDIRGITSGVHAVDPDFPQEGGTATPGLWGGAVLFEDNQITLDWPDKQTSPACSSVIIAARESTVSFLRNQILTKTRLPPPVPPPSFEVFVLEPPSNTPKLVVCACIVEGFAVQFVDNRLTEGYFEAGLSAITRSTGLGNVTAQNTSTHCIVVWAPATVAVFNDELVNAELISETPFCDTLGDFSVNVDGDLTEYDID